MDETNLADAISGLMNDPKIQELVKSLSGEGTPAGEPSGEPSGESPPSMPDLGKLLMLKECYNKAMSDTDPKLSLLSALRPYLSESRTKSLEACLKLLRVYKMAGMLKETDILKELL